MATRLEQIVKRAKELKKTAPASTKWTDLIKKASKQVTPVRAKAYNKATAVRNLGLSGVKKKRTTKAGSHKDTRSHNVNIRVVSGVPDNYSFSFGVSNLYTQKQFTIFGKVELVVFEPKDKRTITVLDGKNTNEAYKTLLAYILKNQKNLEPNYYYQYEETLKDVWGKKLKKLITELNKEITKYNKDIKAPRTVVKKAPAKKSVKKATIKKAPVKKTRAQESEAIRQKVRKDGFTMPHGYAVKKAVRETSIGSLSIDQLKRNTEAIERFTNKHIPYMLLEYKQAPAGQKSFIKKRIAEAKKYVATLKKQNTSLKRHIK